MVDGLVGFVVGVVYMPSAKPHNGDNPISCSVANGYSWEGMTSCWDVMFPGVGRSPMPTVRLKHTTLEEAAEAAGEVCTDTCSCPCQGCRQERKREHMNEIKLYSNDGRFVTEVFVPRWKFPPEVYVWGERFFVHRGNGKYTEADGAYVIPPEMTVR